MFLKKKTMACLLWPLVSHISIFQYYGIHAKQIERTADLILLRKLFALIFYLKMLISNQWKSLSFGIAADWRLIVQVKFWSIYVILTIFICI